MSSAACDPSSTDARSPAVYSEPRCIHPPAFTRATFSDTWTPHDWSVACERAPSRSMGSYARLTELADRTLLYIFNEPIFVTEPGYLSSVRSVARAAGVGFWPMEDPVLPDPDGTSWTLTFRNADSYYSYFRQNSHEPRLLDICALLGLMEAGEDLELPSGLIEVLSRTYTPPHDWPRSLTLRLRCPEEHPPNSDACAALAVEALQRSSCAPYQLYECMPGPMHATLVVYGHEHPVPTLCTWRATLTDAGWTLHQ